MSFLPSTAITLQQQPTPSSCVQTCLAMALGVDARDVLEVFGESGMNQRALLEALSRCGILHNALVFPELVISGWYFAVVPSLNHPGMNHQVLMHFNVETGEHRVLDPGIGKTYDPDARDLMSWAELVYFHPGGRMPATGKPTEQEVAEWIKEGGR